MNRHDFISRLQTALASLPPSDREEILYDYDEHFRNGLAEGKTEEEIARSLGDPRVIAKQYNAHYLVQKAETTASVSNILRAALATISLGFFNLIFMIWPLLGMACALLALFACAAAIIVAGAALFVEVLARPLIPEYLLFSVSPPVHPAAIAFFGVGLIALGLILLIGNVQLSKLFYTGTVRYLKMNQKIIAGVK